MMTRYAGGWTIYTSTNPDGTNRIKTCVMDPKRKNFGRPVKKKSRIGQRKLNKVGHRQNKHSK